jgi:L-ascorbate metabolism protein UlaG (beta-lactamase superfamily)
MVKFSKDQSLAFRWLGVAGMEFTLGGHTLLIDPFLSRPPLKNVFMGRVSPDIQLIKEKIKKADHILITHAHYDHLLDVPVIARQTGAQVCGSTNVCRLLQVHQVSLAQLHELYPFDEIELPYAHIRVIPARHPSIPGYGSGKLKSNLKPPLHLRDYRMDECFSYLIDFEKIKLLIWSSINSQHAQPADVLFLRSVANQSWYDEMLDNVHPRLVIPTHWDNLFLPLSQPIRPFFAPPSIRSPLIQRINLGEFKKKIFRADPSCKILIPQVLQPYDLMAEIG